MKHIGIFGGTFDPIHNGHLALAQIALEKMSLDEIIFVPSYFPPHKSSKNVVAAKDRLEMVRLATKKNPHFSVSDFEVKKSGKSYSIETLKFLRKRFQNTKLFFILGEDAYKQLPTWKNIDEVLEIVEFIVVNRPGYRQAPGKIKCHHVVMPGIDISSSYVRQRMRLGQEVRYWVPGPVAEYIKRKKLYQHK